MLRRAFVLLLATLAVAGCVDDYYDGPRPGYQPRPGGGIPLSGRLPASGFVERQHSPNRVAILLPLSGGYAEIGQAMLRAAQLAIPGGSTLALDARDTGGTPQGAARAAQEAIAAGAGLILGPLTSPETAAVAPVAREAGVAVLAFTNDSSQAQPGVWTMGVTPGQQVMRLMVAAQAQNKGRAAALLPDTDLGHRFGDALQRAASTLNLPAPNVVYHAPGMKEINSAMRQVSEYGSRRGPIEAQIKTHRAEGTAEGRRHAQALARAHIPAPSYGTLLMADTGDALPIIESLLPYYDIDGVQVMGPVQWASSDSGSSHMRGAWYAAPDPESRAGLSQDYSGKYGGPPPAIADLAYDAASIARMLSGEGGFSVAALTRPGGFAGVDGRLMLLPNGEVNRGLAVFRIERGGSSMVEPAPAGGPGA
jgi:branched-chain amino acid transport system substrate-binding protein